MLRVFFILLGLATALAVAPVGAAPSAEAAATCQPDDATLHALPASLVPEAVKAFGLSNAPAAWVRQTTVIRCMGGKILACNAGANLPCGKANTAATLPAADDWCRQNPNADFIPAYITGHDSIWTWRCANGAPATIGPPAAIDAQGYLTQYWKTLN